MRTGYAPSFIRVVGETGRARLARSVCTSKGRQNMLAALRATSQWRSGACVAPRAAAPLVAILAVLALLLAACGGDSPETSPDSSETSTPASGTAPASTPESPTASAAGDSSGGSGAVSGLDIDLSADTRWGDVFDTLAAPERDCVESALGGGLDAALDEPIGIDGEDQASIVSCVDDPRTARAILLAYVAGTVAAELGSFEFRQDEASCLQDLVGGLDQPAIAAFIASSGEDAGSQELGSGLVACLPDTMVALIVSQFGMSPDDLSGSEQSCLRELFSTGGAAGLSGDEFGSRMFACIPDAWVSLALSSFGRSMDDLSDAERACVRELTSGIDSEALSAEDLALGLFSCFPVTIGSSDAPAGSPPCTTGMVLEIGEGCLVTDFGVFYVDPDGWGVLESETSYRLTGKSRLLTGGRYGEPPRDSPPIQTLARSRICCSEV